MTRTSIVDGKIPKVWQRMADATSTTASPSTGVAVTVLDTTKNCRIHSMVVKCTGTLTNLEIHVTIDGQTITFANASATTNTFNFTKFDSTLAATAQVLQETTEYYAYRQVLLEGCSVKVTIEATGTSLSDLIGRVKYSVLP